MAVPEPVTVPGVIVPQARPDGTVSVRVTTLANPLTALSVIVEVADRPALTGEGDVADMMKFWNRNVAVAVWTRELLVPVIVRV